MGWFDIYNPRYRKENKEDNRENYLHVKDTPDIIYPASIYARL